MFSISKLWLASHTRSTVVLLDTGIFGTSREIYIEDTSDGTRTRTFSIGTRSFCVQQNHCVSRMRSQSQLRNYKHIMIKSIGCNLIFLQYIFTIPS